MSGFVKRTFSTRFRRAGFTIIELMIVTALLGILASIALPKFGNMIDKAREATAKGNIGSLRSALSIYYVDNEGIYPLYTTMMYNTGMIFLDDKYIDLDNVIFTVPRYIEKANRARGKWSAKNYYLWGLTQWNNNNFGSPAYIITADWGPTYQCWQPGGLGPAMGAIVRNGCHNISDLNGIKWSAF